MGNIVGSEGRTSLRRGRGGGGVCALIRLSARFGGEEAARLAEPALWRMAGAALGARLRNGLRPEDRLRVRRGEGFEFFIVASAASEGAQALGERMRARLSGLLAVGGLRLAPEAAMGWAAVEGLEAAGRDRRLWRAAAVQARTRLRKDLKKADSALEALLRAALKEGGLRLRHQPILDLRGGRIRAAEALLRLSSAQAPGPDLFIPVAERRGLIRPLGEAALRMAAEAAARWSRLPQAPSFRLGVNVAPHQLEAGDFVETVLRICAGAGCAPGLLTLEITESAALADSEAAAGRLEALRAAGFRVALDDFGAAHSDLQRLSALPADLLKIDAALLEQATAHPQGLRLLKSLGALARSLGMETVGEGIRSGAHLAAVREAGLDHAQGHLIGEPLEEEAWLKRMGQAWTEDSA